MRRLRVLSMAALAVLAIVAVGCGDDDNNGSESGGGGKVTGVQAGTGSRQDEAAEAGKKAAEAAGGNVDLPKKKAGILQILGAIESAQRVENTLTEAIKSVGWTTTVCDAQGDPKKMAALRRQPPGPQRRRHVRQSASSRPSSRPSYARPSSRMSPWSRSAARSPPIRCGPARTTRTRRRPAASSRTAS